MSGAEPDGQPPRDEQLPSDEPAPDVEPSADVPLDASAEEPASKGPPGGGAFTLEGRRAPGLYLVAWILSVGGLAVTLVLGPMASDSRWSTILIFLGAVAVTIGLAAGAGSQVMDRAARDPERYRGPSPLLVFAAYFMALSALGLIVISLIGVDPDQPYGFFVNATIQSLGYALVVWLFVVRTGALTWPMMGWPTWHGRGTRHVIRGIGAGVLTMFPVTLAMVLIGGIIGLLLGVEAPRQFPLSETSLDGAFVALSAGFIVPVGEEIFFRGFMLTAWMRDLGPRTALIRSSLFFAALHLVPLLTADFSEGFRQALMVMAVILPVGFILGGIFIRFGLIAAISAHVTYNTLLLLGAFLLSKLPEPAGL